MLTPRDVLTPEALAMVQIIAHAGSFAAAAANTTRAERSLPSRNAFLHSSTVASDRNCGFTPPVLARHSTLNFTLLPMPVRHLP